MKQIYPFVALAVLLAAGTFFFSNFQISTDQPGGPQLRPREGTGTSPSATAFPIPGAKTPQSPTVGLPSNNVPPQRAPAQNIPVSVPGRPTGLGGDFIRMASFNIEVFGEAKLAKREVVEVLAEIIRNFDVVAVQEIRAQSQSILPTFLQQVNASGARYDYIISERLGRTDSKEQYAYIFNTDTIEVDRRSAYVVLDRDDLLHREPFVAGFRCRRADPNLAFTFSLVNIHTDPDRQDLQRELAVLDDVLNAVRQDGRGEDDIIMLGDFNTSHKKMGDLNRMANLTFVITGNLATNTKGNAQYDNIVFDRLATQEFLGRGGVFDYLREYNLSQTQADQVSDHIPVWGEFSVYEGGVPGRVATRTNYPPTVPNYAAPPTYAMPPTSAPQYATSAPRYAPQPLPAYEEVPSYANHQDPYVAYNQRGATAPYQDPRVAATDSYYHEPPTYSQPRYAQPQYAQPQYSAPRYATPQYAADPRYPGEAYPAPTYRDNRDVYPAPPTNALPRASVPGSRW